VPQSRQKKTAGREPLSGTKLRERAFDLLSRRDHSEWELRRKLLEKGAVAEELPPLLKELRSFNYLNDERFAGNFVRYRAGKAWGRLRFRQELLQRGVSAEVVENVLREAPELQADQLDSKLRRTVEKELRRGKEEKKIIASLLRKGFSVGQVRKALEQIVSEDTLDRLE